MIYILVGQLLSTDQGVLEVGFSKYNPDFAGTPEEIPIAGPTPATHARNGRWKAGEIISKVPFGSKSVYVYFLTFYTGDRK